MSFARRFVLVAGSSAKYWEIDVESATLTLRWGPLGREGQTKSKSFSTPAKAEAEREKLVAKKLAEGYREEGPTKAESVERPRVAWDAKTLALVHPRRTSKIPAPNMDVGKAWKLVVLAFDKETRERVKRGRKDAAAEDRALMDAAIEDFASKEPPKEPDQIVEGVRAQLIGMEAHNANTPPSVLKAHDALVHVWCAAHGPAFAVRAMTETFRTLRCDWGSLYVARKPEALGTFGNINHYQDSSRDPVDVTPWHVLRAHVAAADEATYAKARSAAEPVHDKGADVMFQCALAFVFPDEETWAREVLEKSSYMVQDVAPAMYHCGHALVSCFRDKATICKFFKTGSFHVEFAYNLLDALGPGAFSMLRTYYEKGRFRSKPTQKQLFAALTLIDSDEVAAWMKTKRRDPVVGSLAEAYFSRFS